MYVGLDQECDIHRRQQTTTTATSKRKGTGEDPDVANVECKVQPLADTTLMASMGTTVVETYRGFFPPDVSLQHGDTVVVHTELGDQIYKVEGESLFRGPGLDHTYATEAILKRAKIR